MPLTGTYTREIRCLYRKVPYPWLAGPHGHSQVGGHIRTTEHPDEPAVIPRRCEVLHSQQYTSAAAAKARSLHCCCNSPENTFWIRSRGNPGDFQPGIFIISILAQFYSFFSFCSFVFNSVQLSIFTLILLILLILIISFILFIIHDKKSSLPGTTYCCSCTCTWSSYC